MPLDYLFITYFNDSWLDGSGLMKNSVSNFSTLIANLVSISVICYHYFKVILQTISKFIYYLESFI